MATQGSSAWFRMYSVAEGPNVSYKETVYSAWDMQARSKSISLDLFSLADIGTCQLPFWSVLTPQADTIFPGCESSLPVCLNDPYSKIRSSSLHSGIVHP